MPARNVEKRLERAQADINALVITRAMVVNFFSIRGGSRDSACKVFDSMVNHYQDYLKENGLINPGQQGVPNQIASDILKLYGITKEAISADLKAVRRNEEKTA